MTRRSRKGKVGGARRGAGRPPLGDLARKARIPVLATEAQRQAFASAAETAGESLSAWMVAAGERRLADSE